LTAGTYVLTRTGTGENAAATGDLDITNTLTIVGAGSGQTIIDASGLISDRVFHILPGAGTVVISGATILGGNVTGDGGGILDYDADLTLVNTVVSSNTADDDGGGVYVESGSATLSGGQIISNSASYGGGVCVEQSTATFTQTGVSTITHNSATQYGGGVYVLWRTRHVNVFCPRLFSAIQLPDHVLASRSIVIPLIRTPDRYCANADPLDDEAWPHDCRQLIDDLWALALAHLPQLREYERAVNQKASLTGRNLEPWRALLAVALWLDDHDAQGILHRTTGSDLVSDPTAPAPAPLPGGAGPRTALWDRMETLSLRYQRERSDLETDDLTALVIHALCGCAIRAISAISAINTETPSHFVFTVQDILLFAQAVARMKDGDPDHITPRRVGRALGRMRLSRAPRSGA